MTDVARRNSSPPIRESWVLITGAAAGIGEATARLFARGGARLILADKNRAGVDTLARELRESGTEVLSYGIDVSDREAMEEFADWVHMQVEAVDVLVNNAGVLEIGGLEETSFESWERVLKVNLWGVVHGCKLFMPAMRRRRRGAVVNVASASGMVGFSSMTAYSTAKFAVVGLSQAMRAEYFDDGVVVSVVCPGLVNTRIWDTDALGSEKKAEVAAILGQRGIQREKVAEAIVMAAEKGRAIVPVGVDAQALDWMGRLIPSKASTLITRMTRGDSE